MDINHFQPPPQLRSLVIRLKVHFGAKLFEKYRLEVRSSKQKNWDEITHFVEQF